MVRTRTWLVAGLLTTVLLAAAPAAVAGGTQSRPMAGACSTTFSVSAAGEISIAGTCLLTHLGKSAYHATQTTVPNADGTVHITITGFYTAANGDTLRSTLVGTGRLTPSGSVMYVTTETYTGGTGRFAGASGTSSDVGVASFTGPSGGTSTFVTVGSISF